MSSGGIPVPSPIVLPSLRTGSPAVLLSPTKAAHANIELFYEGTKFYWRSRLNVDFHFFHHTNHNIMEIIPFDVDKGKRSSSSLKHIRFLFCFVSTLIHLIFLCYYLNHIHYLLIYLFYKGEELEHLYINYNHLIQKTKHDLEEKLQKVITELSKDRFKKMPPEKELKKTVLKEVLADYLLKVLVIDSDTGVMGGGGVPRLTLMQSTAAIHLVSNIIINGGADTNAASTASSVVVEFSTQAPVGLHCVIVRRRRKTAPGEFHKAVSEFRSNSQVWEIF